MVVILLKSRRKSKNGVCDWILYLILLKEVLHRKKLVCEKISFIF